MSTEPTLSRVIRILSQYTNNPLYDTSSLLHDVGLDSLSVHSAMLDLENEFQITDLDYDQRTMWIIEDVAKAIDQKLAALSSAMSSTLSSTVGQ